MSFNSPDVSSYKKELDNSIVAVSELKLSSHSTIKIQSLLNVTIYVLATRFLEGSVKHIVYNCCKLRGDSKSNLKLLSDKLKAFNNPMFENIRGLIKEQLNYDIIEGIKNKYYTEKDITLLNQIVQNRLDNTHATEDAGRWYSANRKDLDDFKKEYEGLLNVVVFIDCLNWDDSSKSFIKK